METKQPLLNGNWVKEEIKKEKIKIPSNEWKWKYNITKSMEHKEGSQRERSVELRAYINLLKRAHINKLIMHLKSLKK